MSFGHLLMLSIGAGGLSVATDSPDAFCPPLEEAQEAVAARVGAVTGGQFEARYGLQRDANTGATSLRLVMRDEAGTLVLERELPLNEGDCSHAATVMALILERYFTSHSSAPPSPAPSIEPPQARVEPSLASEEPVSAPPPSEPEPEEARRTQGAPVKVSQPQAPLVHSLRLSLAYSPKTLRLGFAGGIDLTPTWQWLFEANAQLINNEVEEAGYDFSVARHALFTAAVASLRTRSRLRAFAGPELGLQWEQARALDSLLESSGTESRLVPSLGAQAGLSFEATRAWEVGAWGRGAVGLAGRRFVLEMRDGGNLELFALPEFYWQAGAFCALRF